MNATLKNLKQWTVIDKSQWPERGPWDNEPDKVQWTDEATGLPCLAVRNRSFWCGYVGVAENHPAFEKDWMDLDVSVHGGLSFGGFCQENVPEGRGVCHVPEPGQPERVYWLGFDCMHSSDARPAISTDEVDFNNRYGLAERDGIYRDLSYVQRECTDLARQLAEMK